MKAINKFRWIIDFIDITWKQNKLNYKKSCSIKKFQKSYFRYVHAVQIPLAIHTLTAKLTLVNKIHVVLMQNVKIQVNKSNWVTHKQTEVSNLYLNSFLNWQDLVQFVNVQEVSRVIHLSDVMMILVLKDLVVPMLIVNLRVLVQYVDAGNKMVYVHFQRQYSDGFY